MQRVSRPTVRMHRSGIASKGEGRVPSFFILYAHVDVIGIARFLSFSLVPHFLLGASHWRLRLFRLHKPLRLHLPARSQIIAAILWRGSLYRLQRVGARSKGTLKGHLVQWVWLTRGTLMVPAPHATLLSRSLSSDVIYLDVLHSNNTSQQRVGGSRRAI